MSERPAAPENLTAQERLVVPTRGLEPVRGHRLVVFKKVGLDRKLRACLEPGQRLKRSILESPASFIAYAVPCDDRLRYRFESTFESHDQAHSFSPLLTLEYRISDPASLVKGLSTDPLRYLRNETITVVETTLKRLDWRLIEQETVDLEELLFLGPLDGQTNLERLRHSAARYGIGLVRIAVRRQLPDSEIRVGPAATKHSETQ